MTRPPFHRPHPDVAIIFEDRRSHERRYYAAWQLRESVYWEIVLGRHLVLLRDIATWPSYHAIFYTVDPDAVIRTAKAFNIDVSGTAMARGGALAWAAIHNAEAPATQHVDGHRPLLEPYLDEQWAWVDGDDPRRALRYLTNAGVLP
jgi:hypothetical protein